MKNILNIMVLMTKNLKYTVGMDIVTNHKHKQIIDYRRTPTDVPTRLRHNWQKRENWLTIVS